MLASTVSMTFRVEVPIYDEPQRNGKKMTAFKKQKMRVLVRDNFCCQAPGCRINRLSKLTVHHIIPRSQGGLDNLDNLITLCYDHHEALHWPEEITEADTEPSVCCLDLLA